MNNPKSNQGKTEKYSGVVKSVKESTQPKEEPRITAEQVTEAFHSFGFEPNQRNHNDIAYWTSKGISEGPKLIEELHKRRVEINNQEDEERKNNEIRSREKSALSRLSDDEINALFDEYGLPSPDAEWARNHLPNDPKKIRSILEMQRKTADNMLKKHSKNAINSIPEIQKGQGGAAPMMSSGSAIAPMTGQGGPINMQGDMTQNEGPKTPFFIGDHSIVRITNPSNPNASTTWLVDAKRKVLRPFASEAAFRNAFDNPDDAERAVTVITTKELGPGGALEGFTPLQGNKGVQDDGSMDPIEYSPADLKNRYGKPEDIEGENRALSMLDGVFGSLNK